LGIALHDDYALILSTTANYLYRKVHDQWALLDLAPGVCCFEPNGETLNPPFVFITNRVYRIGPQGKLQQTQTLVGDDPTFADGFGNEVAVSDGTLVISATSGDEDRGALDTFEERHGVWVKTQKIVANDGAVGDQLGTDVVISGDIMVAAAGGKDYDYVNSSSGYAFDGQPPETLVYRRENLPWSSEVRFVPYGNITESSGAYDSAAVLHGSQLFGDGGNQYTAPAGVVNVYDLPKGRP
jgi:hypothetical protein